MKIISRSQTSGPWAAFLRPAAVWAAVAQTVLGGPVVQNLSSNGGVQSWTVPNGVEVVSLALTGAQGGRGSDDLAGVGGNGGDGGRVTGRLAVTAGEVLTLHLGGTGGQGSLANNGGGGAGGAVAGGLYAGGRGGNAGSVLTSGGGGGGGGAAAILRGSTLLAVAGGAGGGGGAGGSTEWFLSFNMANRDGVSGVSGSYASANTGANGVDRGTGNDGGGGGGGGGGFSRGGTGGTLRITGNNNTGGNGGSAGENLSSGLASATATYGAVTGAASATITYQEPSILTAIFTNSANVPLAGTSIDVSNTTLHIQLGHAPAAGGVLTVANNTGGAPVVGTLVGLAQGAQVTATYGGDSFRFTLSYTGGTGNDITLTREAARAPLVTGGTSSLPGSENVTLSAAVNPNGFTTTVLVEYGYTSVYGRTHAFTFAPANGSVSQNVSTTLEALKPGTLYHYRISVTNIDGTAATADGTFTTRPVGEVWPAERTAGLQDQTVVLLGGGFVSGATVAFSGGGITVQSVSVDSAQQVSVVIDIDRSAAPGARTITVTNPDGSQWLASSALEVAGFDPGIGTNDAVLAVLALPDGRTLIGGGFSSYDSFPSKRLARLNPDGSFDTTFVPVIDGTVRAIVRQTDGKIVIGGDFTTVANTARARVARLNADGTLDTTFTPGTGANGPVRALLLQADGKVLVGGDFTSVNGNVRNRLARLLANGTVDGTYNPNVDGPVHALLASAGGTLVGGAFGTVGTTAVYNLALLTTAGGVDSNFSDYTVIGEMDFGQRTSGTVTSLALTGTDLDILVGGDFIAANGLACRNLAVVFREGGVDGVGNLAGRVSSLVGLADGRVLVAGNFQKGIVRLSAELVVDPSFATNADAAVHAMAMQADGKLLAGGAFTMVDGVARRGIARFTADGALDLPVRSAVFTVWEPMRLDAVDVAGLAQGLSNRSLVLTGAGFKSGASAIFSNPGVTLVSFTVDSATRMTAVVNVAADATPGPVTLTVNNPDGGSDSLAAAFTVSARPVIAAVTPATRAAGAQNGQLVIDGSHFQAGATVAISGGGITLSNLNVQVGTITARIDLGSAASAGSRDVVVSNPDGGTSTQTGAFTVNAAPTLASLSPAVRSAGLLGQTLVLTGSHFQAGAQVAFSGSGITVTGVTVDSPTQLTLLADLDAAAAPGARAVTVSHADGGSVTLQSALTLTSPPTLTAVSPAEIPQGGGKTVSLSGTGFTAGTTLACAADGITLRSFNVVSDTEITVDLIVSQQVDTGSYALTVSNPDGGSVTLAEAIRVTPGPQILALTPSRRVVGMQNQTLVLSGTNFGPTLSVGFSGGGITVDSVTVNSETSVTLVVDFAADAVAGNRNLSVTNPDRGTFTLENALTLGELPKLTEIAPASRGQGALDQELVITGSGLQEEAQVDFGDGITVKQVTRQSATQLTAVVDVAPTATLGGRSVTITNPDSGAVTVVPAVINPGFIAPGAGPDGSVRSVLQDADGKLVVAGAFSHIGSTPRSRLARLNADGTLDTSFDPGTGFNGDVADVLLQPDGKIFAAGAFSSFNGSPCGPLVRLNVDGSLDPGFTVPASFNGTQVLRIAQQTNGKLLVASPTSVVRLNADGSADASFAPVAGAMNALVLQADGKILVAGAGIIARVSDSGVLEKSQSLGPLVVTALALQPDGKMVVGGRVGTGGFIFRFNADFSGQDLTFSAPLEGAAITALVRLSNGKFLVAASFGGTSGLVRLEGNGAMDTTFAAATGGFVSVTGPLATLLPQADGKVLIGGDLSGYLSRITPDGALDSQQLYAPFTVAAAPTLASLDLSVFGLTTVGQGAVSQTLTFLGSGLVGEPSAFFTTPGITVQSCTRDSSSALTLVLSVSADVAPGPVDLTVINGDGGRASLIAAVEISPRPVIAAVSPSVCSQGTSGLQLEVSGNHFQTGASLRFEGFGLQWQDPVVVSAERLTVLTTIFEDAPTGGKKVIVTNPDGGFTELTDALTVTPGPKATAISPNRLGAGAVAATLVVTGSNFASGTTVTFTNPGVRVTRVTVDSPTQLTLIADVANDAALGGGGFSVINPDRGTATVASIGVTAGFVVGKGLDTSSSGYATANAMVVQPNGQILIAGKFDQYDGVARKLLTRLDPDGKLDASFDPGESLVNTLTNVLNAEVRALALQADGKILVGGHFTAYRGVARNHLLRLNADGSLDTTFDPGSGMAVNNIATSGFNTGVNAIEVLADGRILAAGCFESYNGQARRGIVRILADGSIDPTFDPGAGASVFTQRFVEAMRVRPDGSILLGGTFSKFGGVTVSNMVLLNADGSHQSPFANVEGRVYGMDLQADGKVLLAGYYNKINGTSRGGIARVLADGALDTTFNPGTGISVAGGEASLVKVLADGKILLAGDFDYYNGTARSGIVRLLPDGALDPSFVTWLNSGYGGSPVKAAHVLGDGKLLIAGAFQYVSTTSQIYQNVWQNRVARLFADGLLDNPQPASAFVVNAGPALVAVDVTSVPRGSSGLAVEVTGSGLVAGAVASFSGTDLSVLSCTVHSATRATLVLNVAAGAATGARSLTVINPDEGRASLAAALTITSDGVVSSSESWRQQYFGMSENAGNAADLATPDGDGIANLMKYALGLTPGQSGAAGLPKAKIATASGSRYLSLNLRRDPSRNDVTILVEVQGSIGGTWTEIARSVDGAAFTGAAGVTETDAADGAKDVEIRDTQTIGSAARRFMRVRVER